MKNYSYTKTPLLNSWLIKIEDLRKELLLTPVAPRDEIKLRWYSRSNYIFYILGIHNHSLPLDIISHILESVNRRSLSPKEKLVISLKSSLDYLYHNWLVNSSPITVETIINLYHHTFSGVLKVSNTDLENNLKYIQVNPEHPIIQAALAQAMFYDTEIFSENNELFSHLVFQMFLYKSGYDFRQMMVVEEVFFKDLNHFRQIISHIRHQDNVTEWLEYITASIVSSLEDSLKKIMIEKQRPTVNGDAHLFELNDRQKKILEHLASPGSKITNALAQKIGRVSQITASRDLSRLATLELIFPIGRGRSTYYTKT